MRVQLLELRNRNVQAHRRHRLLQVTNGKKMIQPLGTIQGLNHFQIGYFSADQLS